MTKGIPPSASDYSEKVFSPFPSICSPPSPPTDDVRHPPRLSMKNGRLRPLGQVPPPLDGYSFPGPIFSINKQVKLLI